MRFDRCQLPISRIIGMWAETIAFRPMELDVAKAQARRCNRDEAAATPESGRLGFLGCCCWTKQKHRDQSTNLELPRMFHNFLAAHVVIEQLLWLPMVFSRPFNCKEIPTFKMQRGNSFGFFDLSYTQNPVSHKRSPKERKRATFHGVPSNCAFGTLADCSYFKYNLGVLSQS